MLTVLFICLFSLNACRKEEDPVLAENDFGTRTPEATVIGWKNCHDFQDFDMNICFSDAIDYRCRCDFACVWDGDVQYVLTVKTAGREETITLEPPGNANQAPSSALVGKTRISIEEARPVPCTDYRNYEIYELKVTVSEEGLEDANNEAAHLKSKI